MGKAKRYSMEQIQAAQKRLRSLASRVVGKSKKETVDFLAEDRGGPLCSDRKQRFLSLSFSSLGCLY